MSTTIVIGSVGSSERPLGMVRWSLSGKLQQAWQDVNTGATVWRDVPTQERGEP